MGIDKYNSEGYYDPTPYEALTNILKEAKAEKKSAFKPLVYICSPYSGDVDENVNKARAFCRFALEQQCIPIAPHLMFPQFMDDSNPKDRELAMFMDIVLMGKCNEVWVLSDTISEGMAMEIEKAEKRRQTVRYFNSRYEEVEGL
jgi:hypothetical protein